MTYSIHSWLNKKIRWVSLASVLGWSLMGCAKTIQLPTHYTIDASPTVGIKPTSHPVTLRVNQIQTLPSLSTQQMAYKTSNHQMDYYTLHEWWEPPTELLMPLILHTLDKTKYFKNVTNSFVTGMNQIQLDSLLTAFYADYSNPAAPYFNITLKIYWINKNTQQIIASHRLSVAEPMPTISPAAEAAAAQRATHQLLIEITQSLPVL